MQFKTSLAMLAGLFAFSVQSAPITDANTINDSSPAALGLSKRTNQCEDSSFYDETSGGSPTIADCETIVSNLSGNGKWTIANLGQERNIAHFGTCKFIVQAPLDHVAFVGDQDVQDIIRDSIKKFGRDGRVGARGGMDCDVDALVYWWIRHT